MNLTLLFEGLLMKRGTVDNRQWLTYHSNYEKKAYRIIRAAVRDSVSGIDWNNITENTYEFYIRLNTQPEPIKEAYFNIYFQIGLLHGKRIGREIQREIDREQKDFSLPRFTEIFRSAVANFIERLAPTRITSVSQTLADTLVKEVSKRLREGRTISQVATDMQKLTNSRNFYRWQALRIARTETTAAANYGAIQSAEDTGVEMQKEWITAEDERVRRTPRDQFNHRIMHGVRVDQYQEFIVPGKTGGEFLMYPGDPEGRVANTVNCRCSVGFVPKRDSEGNLIFR